MIDPRIDRVGVIERQQHGLGSSESLQATQIVRQRRRFARLLRQVVVPTGPRPPAMRQQAMIRVQARLRSVDTETPPESARSSGVASASILNVWSACDGQNHLVKTIAVPSRRFQAPHDPRAVSPMRTAQFSRIRSRNGATKSLDIRRETTRQSFSTADGRAVAANRDFA